jgi:hypothetical protein
MVTSSVLATFIAEREGSESKEVLMLARLAIMFLAATVGMGLPVAAIADGDESYRAREEDVYVLSSQDDDDDSDDTDDTGNTGTSGDDSNDGTNSRHSGVSRDRDRSRGDLTKDRTGDGKGSWTRDRSRNHTNDKSRNDTR